MLTVMGRLSTRLPSARTSVVDMVYVHLAIFLGLFQYIVFGALVGAARRKFAVVPPLMTGPGEFERIVRVHQNTLEQLVLFIPGLLGFAHYVSPMWAALVGVLYLLGRIAYFYGYRNSAEQRIVGALMTLSSNMVLVIGAIVGWVVSIW